MRSATVVFSGKIALLLSVIANTTVLQTNAQDAFDTKRSSTPQLQGATNGTIGPKGGSDAMVVTGIIAPPPPRTIGEQLGDLLSKFAANSTPAAKAAPGGLSGKARSREDFHNVLVGKIVEDKPSLKDFRPMVPAAYITNPVKTATPREDVPSGCGLVKWRASVQQAAMRSRITGKPVLVFEMMGRLDREFC